MSRKIDARELLAALGGLLVLVSLFLTWFEPAISGWEAFEALDLVLAALAVAALATGGAALGAAASLGPRSLLPLGVVLTIVVAVQLLSPPPIAWDAELGAGAWLALAGSVLVLLGGLLRTARIDVTVSVGARDARRRVPAVDRRPGTAQAAAPAPSAAPPAGADGAGDGLAPRRSLLDEPDPDPQPTQPFKPVDRET